MDGAQIGKICNMEISAFTLYFVEGHPGLAMTIASHSRQTSWTNWNPERKHGSLVGSINLAIF